MNCVRKGQTPRDDQPFLQGFPVEERSDLFYGTQKAECVKTLEAGGDQANTLPLISAVGHTLPTSGVPGGYLRGVAAG